MQPNDLPFVQAVNIIKAIVEFCNPIVALQVRSFSFKLQWHGGVAGTQTPSMLVTRFLICRRASLSLAYNPIINVVYPIWTDTCFTQTSRLKREPLTVLVTRHNNKKYGVWELNSLKPLRHQISQFLETLEFSKSFLKLLSLTEFPISEPHI